MENVNYGNPNVDSDIEYGPMINNDGLIKVEYQGSLYILVTKPPQADAPKEKAKKNKREKYF